MFEEACTLHVAAEAVRVNISLVLVPLMAELITLLSCSRFAPMVSATFAHCAATKAAAEAMAVSLVVFFPFCCEFSAAIAAKAAATPATDIAAWTSAFYWKA